MEEAVEVQNQEGLHAQTGNRKQGGMDTRHMGTLSISVHEDEEKGTIKACLLLDVQTQEVGRIIRNAQVT